jgi:asparagine synthase (glutamine-hydrolysing)
VLKLSPSDVIRNDLPAPRPYWSLREVAEEGQRNPFAGSDAEAEDELERLLRQSIAGQMISDVPLGAFLSGGIDSSSVVALMQAQSGRPVRTFTIGFRESGYNEAEHARTVAAHIGTEHTELYVSPEEAMAVIPRLPELYDEPFADSSQIPTFLLSKLTRQHVTVSLSGDGGDELFGGYNRYVWVSSVWRRMRWLPRTMRVAFAGVVTAVPPSAWDRVFRTLDIFLPGDWRHANLGDKLHKLADVLPARSPEEIYSCLISHWKHPAQVVTADSEPLGVRADQEWSVKLPDLEHRMMYLDSVSYLPDDILVKLDRAAMGVSLETRVPFLDHRLVEFAWRLPLSMKVRDSQGKWLLRRVLDRHVPRALIERPKMGFGIPLDAWLRGPLKEWAEDLLNASRLASDGFLNPGPVREKWSEHLSGRRNWSYHLWDVLMFQAWFAGSGHRGPLH